MIKIKLTQTIIHKSFTVKYKGKYYSADYANSDGQTLLLCNRDYWEVYNEEGEELPNHSFKGNKVFPDKKELGIKIKLINFCIKHFGDYKPKINRNI